MLQQLVSDAAFHALSPINSECSLSDLWISVSLELVSQSAWEICIVATQKMGAATEALGREWRFHMGWGMGSRITPFECWEGQGTVC